MFVSSFVGSLFRIFLHHFMMGRRWGNSLQGIHFSDSRLMVFGRSGAKCRVLKRSTYEETPEMEQGQSWQWKHCAWLSTAQVGYQEWVWGSCVEAAE